MLFNSPDFLFVFLPIALFGFYASSHSGLRAAMLWLSVMSCIFYGWWNPSLFWILPASIYGNFLIGQAIHRHPMNKGLLTFGVAANLLLLGYFKYSFFFLTNFAGSFSIESSVILPIGISFFTFQQIAYLVDTYQKKTSTHSFLEYFLFVSFFPQLIAGPIVHHAEMMSQFCRRNIKFRPTNFTIGSSIFAIGLFKKVVLADTMGEFADPVFEAAHLGQTITFLEAWGGALGFTFQIYFDFSGYTDMAMGLARLFNIQLPLNFSSPYKATSIIDFWRSWHMTLSRFLRDYLYYPLGGNRKGTGRRFLNLILVMTIGGFWHGANWTFLMWGGLHGGFLCINHGWHFVLKKATPSWYPGPATGRVVGWSLTFIALVFSWVLFRAESVDAALAIWSGMVGFSGMALPVSYEAQFGRFPALIRFLDLTFVEASSDYLFLGLDQFLWTASVLLFVLFLPNTQQLMKTALPLLKNSDALPKPFEKLRWAPSVAWAVFIVLLMLVDGSNLAETEQFLYFQF